MNAQIVFEVEHECVQCDIEMQTTQQEINTIEAENKTLREEYYDCLVQNVKKDVEIEELVKKIGTRSMYSGFVKKLSAKSMNTLRSFKKTVAHDSKFISTAIRGLYEGRLEILNERNLSGRSKIHQKQPVTPEKMNILRGLFMERVKNTTDSAERAENLNQLVKTAIGNINRNKQ